MIVLPWIIITVLTALNALYVAAEFAAVAVQKRRLIPLARGGDRRAAGLIAIIGDGVRLDWYVAACQIGITLSSLVAGAYGQAAVASELGPWLDRTFSLGAASADTAAFLIVLLTLTALQVVLGELVPKSLALQFTERTALVTYLPVYWSASVLRGFIWLLNGSGLLLLRPFGITPHGHEHVHSPEEIEILLAESHRGGALSPEAHRRLERGLHLSSRTVHQMMTPRSVLYAIEASTPPAEFLERILESPYGRVPVYDGTLDRVIGAVSTKDVVGLFAVRGEVPPLAQLLRPIPFVPETLHSHRLVRFLQERQSSKAIVVDEFGGVQGIISIEDVLAQLFGDIADELKEPEQGAEPLEDGAVRLPGTMGLEAARPWLNAPWDGPAATVGGHIIAHLGRLPQEGERLEIDGVDVTIAEMSPTAVRWLVIRPRPDAAPGDEKGSQPPRAPK